MFNQSAPLPGDNALPEVPTQAPAEDKPPFDVTDSRYVSMAALKQLTAEQLAKLELERHNLRLAYIAHGMDDTIKFENSEKTLGSELERVARAIHNVEKYFGAILAWQPQETPTPQGDPE